MKPDLGIPDAFLTGYVTQGVWMVHQIEPQKVRELTCGAGSTGNLPFGLIDFDFDDSLAEVSTSADPISMISL